MAAEHQVVFLSLHGEDVPSDVLSYLKSGLEHNGISVLKRVRNGSEDRRTVLNKIRESSFVLVIFSVGFAYSGDCLDELALVKKRMDIGKLRTIPIYYKLKPKDLTHGPFRYSLQRLEMEEHRTAMGSNIDTLLRTEVRLRNWTEALASVSATSGFIFQKEDVFIEAITKLVNNVYKRDEAIGNPIPMSQITVKDRTEALLLSVLPSMVLGVEGNISLEDPDYVDKLTKHFTEELNKIILEETINKEGPNPIPVLQKSSYAPKHVFISFNGRELRRGILAHLENALSLEGINYFMQTEKGSSDFEYISKVITESSIALVFLTEDYAESEWCLQELMVIMKSMDKGMLKVIPVFFKVSPGQVRRQTGVFGNRFNNLLTVTRTGQDTILGWRKALDSIVNIFGIDIGGYRSEAEFVESLTMSIKSLLTRTY